MKKILAALLATAMSLSLVACGGTPSNPSSGSGSGSGSPDPAPSGDKIAINVIAAEYGKQTKDWWAGFQNDFNAANEGIDLKVEVVSWNDIYTVVNTRVSNNAAPDILNIDTFADYVGDAAMVIAPMLYSSTAEYNYVMDSDFVADLCDRLAAENIHILDTHYSFGFRSVVTNLDVTKPEDLNGHILRATSSALFTKTLEALGATPNAMSFTECLQAIQGGVVEGFEGSTSTLAGAGNPYELVKKVALTNHLIATRWLFMPENVWQEIPEKYQKIIEECAYECGMWEQTSCDEDEEVQKKMLAENGVTWNEVDLDAFKKACEPVIDWIIEEYGSSREAYDQLSALVAEYRAQNA